MKDRQLLFAKLEKSIKECRRHIQWAEYSLHSIKDLFPLTIENYKSLNVDRDYMNSNLTIGEEDYIKLEKTKVQYFDQFIYRYTKLQDTLSARVLKTIIILSEDTDDTRTFVDVLNILEKRQVIKSAIEWQDLRDLRNSITHEYGDNLELQIKILNEVYDAYLYIKEQCSIIFSYSFNLLKNNY